MIVTSNGPQNVGQIHKQFECGNLFLSPVEYQRENAWNLPQKQLLIDTIFRGMDIPKFYLWKVDQQALADGYPEGEAKALYKRILEKKRRDYDYPDPYIFEVVDGQQRIRTILGFMGVKPPNTDCYRGIWQEPFPSLKDTLMAKGKYYGQLSPEQQIKFDESRLTVMVLEKATISEIRDMFLRLQNGTPLNAQQERDAMGSSIGRAARELASLPFFSTSVNFDNRYATHHLVASQMLLLELKGRIASCTSKQLDKLYEFYKEVAVEPSILSKTRRIVGILGRVFPSENPHLNQNYALSLYWLLSRITEAYDIPEVQFQQIRENFERMDIVRLEALARDFNQTPDDEKWEDLTLAMSRGNTGVDGITTRYEIMGQYLFQGIQIKQHLNLDPQRNYTYEEKLILYHKAKGLCQLEFGGKQCARKILFGDAVVDHTVPHSRGGRTILENGRISFKSCNIARGVRDDFDPEKECHLLTNPEGQD